jgi:polyisoprenoid-binding protein YceI
MKKFLTICALAVPLAVTAADEYTLDSPHTFPSFAVSHLGFSVHTGRFNQTSGTFTLDKQGDGSSVNVVIKTASVDTGGDKLDEHLRSPDFFNVEKFPEMTYASTKVKWTSDTTATVDGKLTLLGVTKPVQLKITNSRCDAHPMKKVRWCGFAAEATLKRSDFGMSYLVGPIGDEVKITIQAEGERKDKGPGPKG